MTSLKADRILLKISGESLKGDLAFGHDYNTIQSIVKEIAKIRNKGIKLGIVIGGGNFVRGRNNTGLDRANSDYIGILATVMNAIALHDVLESNGIKSKVFSSLPVETICSTYSRSAALNAIEDRVVIFAGGTGNPFVSTDTAAACRAIEMCCDIMVKATNVDGVYSEDPRLNSNASKFDSLSYDDVISKNLQVMDPSAIFIARDHKLPILVIGLNKISTLASITKNDGSYTLIS